MRYLGNDTNLVREGDLSATNVIPSTVVYRTDDDAKVGGGDVVLSGDYSGVSDAVFEVQVVDDALGSVPAVSAPSFLGVGNGLMTAISADNTVDAQRFTVTLTDIGTQTRAAFVPFQGVTLRARELGPDGNAIVLTIDQEGVTQTPTTYATPDDITAGSNEFTGDRWNFGAATLDAGLIPANAPRLRFGNDPQVYLQFRKYVGIQYVYSFSPAPVRDIAAGSLVFAVSGGRTVSVTDGVAPESYPGIVTLFDLLNALRTTSSLVDVDGVVVNDRTPGGMGALELSVYSESYVASIVADGSDTVKHAVLSFHPSATAPIEEVVVTCMDAAILGQEKWKVVGDVSGRLADATTSLAYASGDYAMVIPPPIIQGDGDSSATIVVEYKPDGDHAEDTKSATLCVVQPRLGAGARARTFEFVRTKRPPKPCDCTTGSLEGGPNADCLGLDPGGEEVSDASRIVRMQRLATAVKEYVASNTNVPCTVVPIDVDWIEDSADILNDCLQAIQTGTLELPPWTPSTAVQVDDMREPTARNGYRYAVSVKGTTGSTEPATWNATVGGTTADGGVTWINIGQTPYLMWDAMFESWKTEMEAIADSDLADYQASGWSGGTIFATDSISTFFVYPTTRNGWIYQGGAATARSDGNVIADSGSSEPSWPTVQFGVVQENVHNDATTPFTSHGIRWFAKENYWLPTQGYALSQVARPGIGRVYEVSTAGTSGASEPAWGPDVVADGSVVWTAQPSGASDLAATCVKTKESYFEKFRTAATEVLTSAGISPDFSLASSAGSSCWRDYEDSDFWWVYSGTESYAPIQDGHYYHSCVFTLDPDGNRVATSTHEFGFGPKWGCPDQLKEGDKLVITIGGTAGGGYEAGDTFSIAIANGTPLTFSGGQDGDDTLTWSVVGSAAGALADYPLVTTGVLPYVNGGIGFTITPGGLAFALGDAFTFDVEGGRFQWRKDGGAWSSIEFIAESVTLGDGLSANFVGGTAPSWVTGDTWTFTAEATNGVDGIRQPTERRLSWTDETEIVAEGGPIQGVWLCDHTIPADATIIFEGSADGFATSPLSMTLPWSERNIWRAVTANFPEYRVSIDTEGSLQWLYLGLSTEAELPTGVRELGKLTKRKRMPGLLARTGLGVDVKHEALSQESVDAIESMLEHACYYDEQRIGIVPNDAEPESGLVEYQSDSLELTDQFDFQPRAVDRRLISVAMTLAAAQ